MLQDEFFLIGLHLGCQVGPDSTLNRLADASFELLVERLVTESGRCFFVLGHFCEHLDGFLLVTIHFLSYLKLKYFLYKFSELTNGLIEQRQQLISL